jgi:hypothetical protein
MVQVNDVINGMVDKLDQCAKEVTRVLHEFGTRCNFGGYACTDGVQSTWADLTVNLKVSFLSSSIILRLLPFLMLSPNCLIFLPVEHGKQCYELDALHFRGHQGGRNGRLDQASPSRRTG